MPNLFTTACIYLDSSLSKPGKTAEKDCRRIASADNAAVMEELSSPPLKLVPNGTSLLHLLYTDVVKSSVNFSVASVAEIGLIYSVSTFQYVCICDLKAENENVK